MHRRTARNTSGNKTATNTCASKNRVMKRGSDLTSPNGNLKTAYNAQRNTKVNQLMSKFEGKKNFVKVDAGENNS